MDQISLSQNSNVAASRFANSNAIQPQGKVTTSDSKNSETKTAAGNNVTISEEGKRLAEENSNNNSLQALTAAEQKEVEDLKQRNEKVRAHEQAHLAAAGRHALGGAHFSTQKGPDGNSYATSGHVSVDISKEKDPEATIAKMRIIRRAALAPANPSSADRQIAARASMIEQEARTEINSLNEPEVPEAETASNLYDIEDNRENKESSGDQGTSSSFTAKLKESNSTPKQNFSTSVLA